MCEEEKKVEVVEKKKEKYGLVRILVDLFRVLLSAALLVTCCVIIIVGYVIAFIGGVILAIGDTIDPGTMTGIWKVIKKTYASVKGVYED